MASVQQAHQLSGKAKAKVGKAIEEAKNVLANAKTPQDQHLTTVAGAMHNDQEKTLEIHSKHNYQGDFLGDPAQSIPKHDSGAFLHQALALKGVKVGPTDTGSKAAIIYAQYGVAKPDALGWLMAWYKPPVGFLGATSKVYVDAGKVERLDNIGWDEIEKRLNESREISRYWDSETGADASAEIQNFSPDVALVGAHFDINNQK